jgi:hypothetical protein
MPRVVSAAVLVHGAGTARIALAAGVLDELGVLQFAVAVA